MLCKCWRCLLIVVGVLLLTASIFPVFVMLPMSDGLRTGLVLAKLLMLPVGAFCLAGAAALSSRARRK
jgi:hypothetical protein